MQELERLRSGLANAGCLIYERPEKGDTIEWSGSLLPQTVSALSSITTHSKYISLIHKDDQELYSETLKKAFTATDRFQIEYRLCLESGKTVWVEDIGGVHKTGGDAIAVGCIKVLESVVKVGYPDGEYQYNSSFIKSLGASIKQSIKLGQLGCFMKLSLNNLPTVISWYGKDIADRVIEDVALKIRELMRPEDIVGRTYIDQLGIIMHATTKEEVETFVKKFNDFIRNYQCPLIKDPVSVRSSMGGVYFPADASTAEEAIHRAYIALSSARDPSSASFYCDYNEAESVQARSKDQIGMMHYLRQAVHKDRLRLAFQPIVESKSGEIYAHECLLRIVGDDGKISSAGMLVPIAEKMGFIDIVDQFVLEKVVQELKQHPDICFTFNVSNMTTDNPKWLAMATKLLTESNVANRIIVEITETAAQRDLRQTAYFVASLQALGCKVALDDFGAGYTSFRQLKSLSVDLVKIDGAFIVDLPDNSENLLFIKTLVDFNNGYGLKTIAENVESGEVAKILMDLNIDYMQGYYFGKPEIKRNWMGEK